LLRGRNRDDVVLHTPMVEMGNFCSEIYTLPSKSKWDTPHFNVKNNKEKKQGFGRTYKQQQTKVFSGIFC
jgi:hypothetical protein